MSLSTLNVSSSDRHILVDDDRVATNLLDPGPETGIDRCARYSRLSFAEARFSLKMNS